MTRIFLSGGGNEEQSKRLDQLLVSLIPKNKRMLYIPTAMQPHSSNTFGSYFDWIKSAFAKLHFKNIDMWVDLEGRTYSELKKYCAVYLGGGNTFSLLNDLKKSGFDKLLKKYIRDKGIVYGGSAGAIVLGRDIRTAAFGKDSDKNLVRIKRFDGLNLVKNCAINCHYTKKDDRLNFKFIAKHKYNVIALPERTGLYITNNRIKIIGYEPAYLFTKNKKTLLKINSTI